MVRTSLSRRDIVSRAMAAAGMVAMPKIAFGGSPSPQCRSVRPEPASAPPFGATPLGTAAKAKKLLFGAQLDIAANTVYGKGMYDPVYRDVVFQEKPAFIAYGSCFKFGTVCPDPPNADGSLVFTQKQYGVTDTWYAADDLTGFVKPQGARARADALIWNETSVSPSWLKPLPPHPSGNTPAFRYNLSFIEKYMSAALKKMTQLQAGQADFFHSVGVVNEPIIPNFSNPQMPTPATFRDGPWLPPGRVVATFEGVPRYIVDAFHFATVYRDYWAKKLGAPATSANFFLNEAACDTDQFGPAMRPALITLLENMIAAKLEIKGVGLECHLQPQMMNDPYNPDWTAFGQFIQQIAALGLEVYITELDVLDYETSCSGHAGSAADSSYLINIYYETFLREVLQYTAVKAVTVWDMSDRYSFYRVLDVSTWFGYNAIPRPKPAGDWPHCATMPPSATAIACPRPDVYGDTMEQKGARQKIAAAFAAAPTR